MRRGSTVQKIYLSVQKSLAIYLLTGIFHLLNRQTTVESAFQCTHIPNDQFSVLCLNKTLMNLYSLPCKLTKNKPLLFGVTLPCPKKELHFVSDKVNYT